MVSFFLKDEKWLAIRTLTVAILVWIAPQTQPAQAQNISSYMKNSRHWKDNLSIHSIAHNKSLPNQVGQHFFGRYLITTFASVGVWTLSVAAASLIDNGTVSAPRAWFRDHFFLIARPSVVLASSTFSMLLYKRIKLKTFLTTTAMNSALLFGSSLCGKLLSEESDVLLQLTTTFFLVPLTSTLYHHILSSKEEKGFKVGKVQFDLMIPSFQQANGKLLPVLGFHLRW